MLKTLADLNAAITRKSTSWPYGSADVQYVLRSEYVVGMAGRHLRGTHAHVLRIETIVEEPQGHRPGTMKLGDVFAAHPLCHGNYGQHGASTIPGADTDKVTCSKCIARIEVSA